MRLGRPIYLLPLALLACDEHSLPHAPAVPTNAPDGSRPTPLPKSTLEGAMKPGPTANLSLNAGGPTILHYPSETPGPPYYALFGYGFTPNDAGWVGIVFVRSPACVPPGFNLLDWLNPPTAWGCALTVEGQAWWHDPAVPPAFQLRGRGTGAVPVYFVTLAELQAAIADNVLTMGELQGLPSLLVGSATFLEHVAHNTNQPTNHGHETLVSRGTLADGRTFEFRYNEKFLPETGEHVFPNVKIDFE